MADIAPTRQLVKSPTSITQSSDYTTKVANGTANVWSTVFKVTIPLGIAFEMTPVNFFHTDFKDTAGNSITVTAADQFRIVKANANSTEKREIWSGPATLFTGNIYDEFQRPKLRVPVVWSASELILLDYLVATAVGKDYTHFVLEGMQYYQEV